MNYLFVLATILIVLGISVIFYVILLAIKLKSENKSNSINDEDMRKQIQRLVPLNLGGLFLSAFGIIVFIILMMLG